MPRWPPACWSTLELAQCVEAHNAEEDFPLGQISCANAVGLFSNILKRSSP